MVYSKNFVVAIKVAGRILREHKDFVLLPFGAEYSVLIKNLNAVRAKFKLSIDGTDATSGTWIVVPPNSDVEMERFITNGNWDSGNRFKFIERTSEIEAHRGVKVDDGLVRVEYQTEIVHPVVITTTYEHPRWPHRPRFIGSVRASGSSFKGIGASAGINTNYTNTCSTGPTYESSEAGITVPGSISNQKFVAGEYFDTGNSEVIVLHLRGRVGKKAVSAPITVKTVWTCPTCGKKSKQGEFCQGCGTALEMI